MTRRRPIVTVGESCGMTDSVAATRSNMPADHVTEMHARTLSADRSHDCIAPIKQHSGHNPASLSTAASAAASVIAVRAAQCARVHLLLITVNYRPLSLREHWPRVSAWESVKPEPASHATQQLDSTTPGRWRAEALRYIDHALSASNTAAAASAVIHALITHRSLCQRDQLNW